MNSFKLNFANELIIEILPSDVLSKQEIQMGSATQQLPYLISNTLLFTSLRSANILAGVFRNIKTSDINDLLNSPKLIKLLHLHMFNYGIGILDVCYEIRTFLRKCNVKLPTVDKLLKEGLYTNSQLLTDLQDHISKLYKELGINLSPINFVATLKSYKQSVATFKIMDYTLNPRIAIPIHTEAVDRYSYFRLCGTKYQIHYYSYNWTAEFDMKSAFKLITIAGKELNCNIVEDVPKCKYFLPDTNLVKVVHNSLSATFQQITLRALGIHDIPIIS